MLTGKKILIGITGSIAAYKTVFLVRELVKEGAEVKVLMTPAAADFVSPLTLSTLSRNPVLYRLAEGESWTNHVMLGRWSDLFLIAPLSCNTMAKMAHGFCDNLLLATYLSATCPVAVAPAMDEDMWLHPATVKNMTTLKSHGVALLPVERGALASGLSGEGRMADQEVIMSFIRSHFLSQQELSSVRVLVTAGPTEEAIDPVRYISNRSTGKMGIALAEELAARGASVDLVLGPVKTLVQHKNITVHEVVTAAEMYAACIALFPLCRIAVMNAAVADYRPASPSENKMKKTGEVMTIELVRNADILKDLGKQKREDQLLVGFALETNDGKTYAIAKLREKNADMIVLNSLADAGAGFGYDTNQVTIFETGGIEREYDRKSKQQVAADVVDRIVKRIQHAQ